MNLDDIKIDSDFESLLPALSDETRESLRQRIIADGKVTDPITVWQEELILLDGHNRLSIYRAESDATMIDPPRVELRSFASRIDAMNWMVEHQKERRNWTEADATYARGKIYLETRKDVGRPANNGEADFTISGAEPKTTAEKVAESHGVTARTVYASGRFTQAVDAIKAVNAKAADDIRAGRIKIPQSAVIALADSGDIASGLKNLRLHGDWRGKQEETEEPTQAPDPLEAIRKRVGLLEAAYNVMGGHVTWLAAHATTPKAKTALDMADDGLKAVFDCIRTLKGLVK